MNLTIISFEEGKQGILKVHVITVALLNWGLSREQHVKREIVLWNG